MISHGGDGDMDISILILFSILIIIFFLYFINGVVAFYLSLRLYFYLLRHKQGQFKRITSLPGNIGIGLSNPFKWFPYIFNDENFDDIEIKKIKIAIRPRLKWILWTGTILILLIFLGILLIQNPLTIYDVNQLFKK